jgi:hypothetical protein
MSKVTLALLIASVAVSAASAAVVWAQYPSPSGGVVERMLNRGDNPDMNCHVQRHIDQDGYIVWLQMTCQAQRYQDR